MAGSPGSPYLILWLCCKYRNSSELSQCCLAAMMTVLEMPHKPLYTHNSTAKLVSVDRGIWHRGEYSNPKNQAFVRTVYHHCLLRSECTVMCIPYQSCSVIVSDVLTNATAFSSHWPQAGPLKFLWVSPPDVPILNLGLCGTSANHKSGQSHWNNNHQCYK